MVVIQAPKRWTAERYDDRPYNDSSGIATDIDNISFKEPVFGEIADGAVETIDRLLSPIAEHPRSSYTYRLEVQRLDSETLTVEHRRTKEPDTADYPEEWSRSSFSKTMIRDFQRTLDEVIGEHWRIEKKRDERMTNDTHNQILVVKRVLARRFMYDNEGHRSYHRHLYAQENPYDEAVRWGDFFDNTGWQDIYAYRTTTGTVHLVRGSKLRDAPIGAERPVAECGRSLDVQAYAEDRLWLTEGEFLLDDLCGTCEGKVSMPEVLSP